MLTTFKDHFSGHATEYAEFRPGYPRTLFEWLAQIAPSRQLAWDSATGNGQAAVLLSRHFEKVVASDASARQIENAVWRPNISYLTESAEHSSLNAGSVDLATVAQAYHWFAHDDFHKEVNRVVKPGGLLAVWAYPLARISETVDRVVFELYESRLGDHWPEERRHVERGYRDLNLPWPEIAAPSFKMQATWTLAHLIGYLNTWSGVREFMMEHGSNPISDLAESLASAWGEVSERKVRWPIILRVARKPTN